VTRLIHSSIAAVNRWIAQYGYRLTASVLSISLENFSIHLKTISISSSKCFESCRTCFAKRPSLRPHAISFPNRTFHALSINDMEWWKHISYHWHSHNCFHILSFAFYLIRIGLFDLDRRTKDFLRCFVRSHLRFNSVSSKHEFCLKIMNKIDQISPMPSHDHFCHVHSMFFLRRPRKMVTWLLDLFRTSCH
jgi:hypothetical protein